MHIYYLNERKKKKQSLRTVPECNHAIVETGANSVTQIYTIRLVKGIVIQYCEINLIVWAKNIPLIETCSYTNIFHIPCI